MPGTQEMLQLLSLLTVGPPPTKPLVETLATLDHEHWTALQKLAGTHHVLVRAMEVVHRSAAEMGFSELAQRAQASAQMESAQIVGAIQKLSEICTELEAAGCPMTVLKSLDHWPDFGRDIDLYTGASLSEVKQVLCTRFQASVLPRSWGDRLAEKCSFAMPGLEPTLEVHSRRLGQAGEHVALAARLERRRVPRQIAGHLFYVPAAEEQVIAATLQRMYRHLFFRICDIVNTAHLIETRTIDYQELRWAASEARVWTGVATFLVIVCEYVKGYRATAPSVPEEVRNSSLFGANKFFVRGQYLRLPLLPEAAQLYGRQVTATALGGDFPGAFRLSLLPPLASAAVLAYKFTGSNQGIW
jgi:hypothetical protein